MSVAFRALRIVRENGSFGFVVKGSNPAYIETTDANGAAEKAGFLPGDFIMKLNGIDVRQDTNVFFFKNEYFQFLYKPFFHCFYTQGEVQLQ